MKKILGYSLAVLLATGAGLYVAFFFNPQTPEQDEINAVWARFGEDIAALNEVVEGAPFNRDEQTAAEGYRHIARFLATFLAYQTDFADPDYPQFMRFPNAVARVGWDNPDNPYLSFPVRGDHVYRLRGNVNAFDLVTINVYSGLLGHTPISEIRHVSGLVSDDLIVDENGDSSWRSAPNRLQATGSRWNRTHTLSSFDASYRTGSKPTRDSGKCSTSRRSVRAPRGRRRPPSHANWRTPPRRLEIYGNC